MRPSILSRYLDPDILALIADRQIRPRDLIIGNLAGAHKSPLAGFAVEFTDHREYVPGDDPKHIDWRVYFNRDKYFVKQYELETNLVCHLLLDVSASMRYGEGEQQKLAYAARLLMMLAFSVIKHSDKVSLALLDDSLRGLVPPSHVMEQVLRMTDQLDRIEATEKTQLGPCIKELAGRLGRRAVVMIASDFFSDRALLEQALQRLRYDHHEVVLFHVLHQDELIFPFADQACFQGLESADRLPVRAADVRDAYLAAFARFRSELEQTAEKNRCEYVLTPTQRPLADVLVEYLNQRSRRPVSR